jgi:hypothetical protein
MERPVEWFQVADFSDHRVDIEVDDPSDESGSTSPIDEEKISTEDDG